jgi:hypothetical protein
MDLYSCKDFDLIDVLKHLEDGFGAYQCNYMVIDRNDGQNAVVEKGIQLYGTLLSAPSCAPSSPADTAPV